MADLSEAPVVTGEIHQADDFVIGGIFELATVFFGLELAIGENLRGEIALVVKRGDLLGKLGTIGQNENFGQVPGDFSHQISGHVLSILAN